MTDPVAEEGEWIIQLDLLERGSELVLEEHAKPGVCGAKCKTIARAAREILGDHDTDLGELLWKVISCQDDHQEQPRGHVSKQLLIKLHQSGEEAAPAGEQSVARIII